jgi:hypothetical protein
MELIEARRDRACRADDTCASERQTRRWASEKQIPQAIGNIDKRREMMGPLETMPIFHMQEVRGSSPCAPTIFFA